MYSKREQEIMILRGIILEKYRIGRPEKKLTTDLVNQIYHDVVYLYDKYGFELAKNKVKTERLHYTF